MDRLRIGFAMTGSFCTFEKAFALAEKLAENYTLLPILSETAATTDTRFGTAEGNRARLRDICGREPLTTIPETEPIGPKKLIDLLLIAPCTGNTLAKLAWGVNDTAVTMAAKAQVRNGGPVLLAVSTNDGLGASAKNIGQLLVRESFFFVPFAQDDPVGKPRSLAANLAKTEEAIGAALEGKQLQPLLMA